MSDAAPAAAQGRTAPVRLAEPRTEAVRIRLSPQEKAELAARARAAGYDTVAAFTRARTLRGAE